MGFLGPIFASMMRLMRGWLFGKEALKAENQQFKDEINRLKGEQGKPEIKAKCKKESLDHSSEKERQAEGDPETDEKTTQRNVNARANYPR